MHHASETPNTETGTRFEALVVKWNQPFHESDVVVVNVTSQQESIGYQAMMLLHSAAFLAELLLNLAGFSHC